MNNQVALLKAVKDKNPAEVQRVVDAGGVDLNPPAGVYEDHPLLLASYKGHVDIVRCLLDRGADVNQVDKNGGTALIYAALNNQADVLLLLLQRDANVNAQEREGYAALHAAAHNGFVEVIRVLLDYGADRTLKNNNGETAEDDALGQGKQAAADRLREHVARVSPINTASPALQPSPAASAAPPSTTGQTDELATLRAQLQVTTDELVAARAHHVTLRQELEAANAQIQERDSRLAEFAQQRVGDIRIRELEVTLSGERARSRQEREREAQLLSDAIGALPNIDARRASSVRLRESLTATSFTYTARLGQRRRRPGQRDAAFYGSCAAAYAVEPRAGAGVEGGESAIDEVLLPLCVKVMFNLDEGDHQGTQDMLAKFRAEWEILADEARLPWHPNVMRIYHQFSGNVREMGLPDYDADAGNARTVCMVMPRLETNLGSLISRRLEAFLADPPTRDTIFSAAEFFYYGLQLCLAVAHLHHHRIVHRDLYPANVLLGGEHIHAARDGVLAMPQQLLVSDFGCCLDATRDTVPGTFHLQYVSRHVDRGGNASYLAPEVMRAVSGPGAIIDYDKNDVFAAGRCLYAMVSTRDLLATCGGATHAYADAHFTPPNGFRDATAAADDDHVTAALRAMLRAEPTDRCSADAAVQMMARGHRTHPLE